MENLKRSQTFAVFIITVFFGCFAGADTDWAMDVPVPTSVAAATCDVLMEGSQKALNEAYLDWLKQEHKVSSDHRNFSQMSQQRNSKHPFKERVAPGPLPNKVIYENSLMESQLPLGPMLRYCAPELFNQKGELKWDGRFPTAEIFTRRYLDYVTNVLGLEKNVAILPGHMVKNPNTGETRYLNHLQQVPAGFSVVTGVLTDLDYYSAIGQGILPVAWSDDYNDTFELPMFLHELGHLAGVTDREYALAARYTSDQMARLINHYKSQLGDHENFKDSLMYSINGRGEFSIYDFFENLATLDRDVKASTEVFFERYENVQLPRYGEQKIVIDGIDYLETYRQIKIAPRDSAEPLNENEKEFRDTVVTPLVEKVKKLLKDHVKWVGGSMGDGITTTRSTYTSMGGDHKLIRDFTLSVFGYSPMTENRNSIRMTFEDTLEGLERLKRVSAHPGHRGQALLEAFEPYFRKELKSYYIKLDDTPELGVVSFEDWLSK